LGALFSSDLRHWLLSILPSGEKDFRWSIFDGRFSMGFLILDFFIFGFVWNLVPGAWNFLLSAWCPGFFSPEVKCLKIIFIYTK